MCKKTNFKHCPSRIDKCMKNVINFLKSNGFNTVACCCGHGKYPMTIVINFENYNYEIFSDTYITRTKRFYRRDNDGYYYIPETIMNNDNHKIIKE